MSLQGIAIFCLVMMQHSLCYDEIDASKDPILQFLQLDADSPPEYDFVKIEHFGRLHKRAFTGKTISAGRRMRIRAFGNNVNLWLRPRDSNLATEDTPVYYSRYSLDQPGYVNIVQQLGLMKGLGRILEDPEHLASLVIGTDGNGRTTVNGRIESKKLIVRSLPDSVVSEYARKSRSIDNNFSNVTYHVVYRINDDFDENNSLGAVNQTMLRQKVAQSISGTPVTLYPKILVVVDYSVFKEQGRDINGFLEYLLAFWNGVDLKYRAFTAPRVRFHISGIVIGVDPKAIPYISNYMLGYYAFGSGQAMINARHFFYNIKHSIPLKSYDIAVTMTRLAFGLNDDANIVGLGWIASVCLDSTGYGRMEAVAIARDNGLFSGVHIAAHELGHVFGLGHDVKSTDDCNYSNGFIMSFIPSFTTNSSSFSACSLQDFQRELDSHHLECMYESPQVYSRNLPKLMPGRVVGLKEQCFVHGWGLPCYVSTVNICANLYCLQKNSNNCRNIGIAALEGSACGNENEPINRYCVHSQCVPVQSRVYPVSRNYT